jgi:undecaprenyl diphosphate synthase
MTEGGKRIPRHVALIMDGNGRWANERGLPRRKGHEAGAESVRATMEAGLKFGVEILTFYAFSVENWKRPEDEVSGLMNLLPRMLIKHENILHEQKTALRAIGRLDRLPPKTLKELKRVMEATAGYSDRKIVLALNYGGRSEIADAAQQLAYRVQRGELKPEEINEEVFATALYAPDIPDPDLLIRTSGEQRLSNFLLWQLSYAEFIFVPEYWPDFREEVFARALETYAQRDRRFGGITPC